MFGWRPIYGTPFFAVLTKVTEMRSRIVTVPEKQPPMGCSVRLFVRIAGIERLNLTDPKRTVL